MQNGQHEHLVSAISPQSSCYDCNDYLMFDSISDKVRSKYLTSRHWGNLLVIQGHVFQTKKCKSQSLILSQWTLKSHMQLLHSHNWEPRVTSVEVEPGTFFFFICCFILLRCFVSPFAEIVLNKIIKKCNFCSLWMPYMSQVYGQI